MKKRIVLVISLMIFLVGLFGVASEVKSVEAGGTIYIRADGSIDPPTAPISTDDNVTYTFTDNINDSVVVERSHIIIDGAGYTLNGTGTGELVGFTVDVSYNVTIHHVNIEGFGLGKWIPAILLNNTSYNTIFANTLTNNDLAIGLSNSSNNNIFGNTITNKDYGTGGIGLWDMSSSNTISGNNLTNNLWGIVLVASFNNTISGNHVTGSSQENILFIDSSNNIISGNNITKGGLAGIKFLQNSSNNVISGNNLTNNNYGFRFFQNSSNNVISGNNIAGHAAGGIAFHGSDYNIVFGNNITDNEESVWLEESSHTKFYHNNFIDNTKQIFIEQPAYGNAWDDGYPSGGNYWSDHVCTGNPSDGSQPYAIDANNVDRYPFQDPSGWLLSHGPWAVFTYSPLDPLVNESVVFDASASVPGWNGTHKVPIANYTWDFGDGTPPVTVTDPVTAHNYTVVGPYTVNLTVVCQDDPVLIAQGLTSSPVTVEDVQVIPEFPTWTSMLLMLIVLTVAIAIHKRRLLKTTNH